MYKTTLITCGMGIMLGSMGAFAADPVVYPVPQKAEYKNERVAMPKKIVTKTKAEAAKAGAKVDSIPDVSGAYSLEVTPDSVQIIGFDARGVFYGKQTLKQLADEKGQVPLTKITDWPDIEFRGSVEGFYGGPWSHQARLSQIKFYGENKLNT